MYFGELAKFLTIIIAFLNGWILIGIAGILGAVNFMFQPIHNSLLADVTVSEKRGIVYGFSAGISFGDEDASLFFIRELNGDQTTNIYLTLNFSAPLQYW